jgi:DNA recombination protein RmuC
MNPYFIILTILIPSLVIFLIIFFIFLRRCNDQLIKSSLKEIYNQIEENKSDGDKSIDLSFTNIANKILEEKNKALEDKNETLSQRNLTSLDLTLKPFKEKFGDLEKQISESRIAQSVQGETFKNQVESILEVTKDMQDDAKNLTNALKGDSKTQGLWGEQILARTLEQSGLEENLNYKLQDAHEDEQGNKRIPDAVIYLPGDRNIVIDSKVSLRAYESFMNEDNPELKKSFLKKHVQDMKARVKELKDKDYNSLLGINSPDYVLVFIPIESAYSAAVTYDWEFQKLSSDSKIAFATPTTLMAILRMSENLWRLDKQNENAERIAERAGLLIDKFEGLLEDLVGLGKNIKNVEGSYSNARNKLDSGKGNIFNQIEDLTKLGAKNKKALNKPREYILEDKEKQ